MRTLLIIFILTTLICFNGCNFLVQNKNESNCDSILKDKKLISKTVDLYEIDTIFYNYLDTIIDYEINKKYFNKCYSCFLFSTSLVQSTETLGLDEMLVSTINRYMYDYTRCLGIFNYKGYIFICDSLCDKSLLNKTNKMTFLKYFEMNKYLWQIDIDDKYSTWYFVNKNNGLVKTGHYFPPN
jgi:hypothetical protein